MRQIKLNWELEAIQSISHSASNGEFSTERSYLTQQTICLILRGDTTLTKENLVRGGTIIRLLHQYLGATNMIRQCASRLLTGSVLGVLAAVVCGGPLGAANETQNDDEAEAERERGLKNMQRSAAQYSISSAD